MHIVTYMHNRSIGSAIMKLNFVIQYITTYFILLIKTSGSESRPRKVELTCVFKKRDDYRERILHITTKPVFVLTNTSLMAVIFIS